MKKRDLLNFFFCLGLITGCSENTVNNSTSVSNSINIIAGPVSNTSDPFALFSIEKSSDVLSLECALDNEDYKACSDSYMLPSLNNQNLYDRISIGNHTLKVRGINSSNQYTEEKEWSWTVTSILDSESQEFLSSRLIGGQVMPQTTDESGSGWKGIFRINCEFDHASYEDPIVFPGIESMAHMHMFYGTKNIDAFTTFETLFTSSSTGCSGSILNRSGYWAPAILAPKYDQLTGERSVDDNGEPAWEVVKAKVGEGAVGSNEPTDAHEVFYYSASVDNLNSIQPPPIGLRIIAGSAAAGPSSIQDTSIVRWHCVSWFSTEANGGPWSTTIPECGLSDMIRFDIFFPSCWDGINLDSDNHQDHMAYPISTPNMVCPSTHPVPIARVSFHYSFPILPRLVDPISLTSKGWRLASDSYTLTDQEKGGFSLHGDWFNGWHPEAMDILLENCIKGRRDCHDGNLAMTSQTSQWTGSLSLGRLDDGKGTEAIPEIINMGLGHGHHQGD